MIALLLLMQDAGLELFERRIRPMLIEHCYRCHSEEARAKGKLKGGLALDTREGLRAGGDSGPDLQLLVQALKHEGGLEMPPVTKLPGSFVTDLERWIAMGAPDPRDGKAATSKKGVDFEQARAFWAFQPLREGTPDIDRYVDDGLLRQGLTAAPEADPRTLLRRAHFDLAGLPPTDLDEPYEAAVDRLLASPRFGERWGRHWLDAARFAESSGGPRNMLWPHAWRYRAWVVDALNADLPYPDFVRRQIAGDLLGDPIATGFLALGTRNFEEPKREVFRMDGIDEQIDVLGRAFLGLSISCARCHDHKFDPIPTSDYYALAGIFRSTETLHGRGPMGIKGLHDAELLALDETLAGPAREHLKKVQAGTQSYNDGRADRYRVVREIADQEKRGASETHLARLRDDVWQWDVEIKRRLDALNALKAARPADPGWAMGAREGKAEDCRVHIRGEVTTLGPVVPRGLPWVLGGAAGGRRELADAIATSPLAARVFVNRVWAKLFGRGLVATPDEFGVNGARPSHPELLDALAVDLRRHGSLKRLIRTIVLSRAYRRASIRGDADPDNVWLARFAPRRLEIEAFRDAVLSVSGELDLARPASRLAALDPLNDDELFPWKPCFEPKDVAPHRSVWMPIVRGALPEPFALFDFESRAETVVPAQALWLLNGPWMIERARATAKRFQDVDALYAAALGRRPSSSERARATSYVTSGERWISFCQALLASVEFRSVE